MQTKSKRWTDKELNYLILNYTELSIKDLALKLNRTERAVYLILNKFVLLRTKVLDDKKLKFFNTFFNEFDEKSLCDYLKLNHRQFVDYLRKYNLKKEKTKTVEKKDKSLFVDFMPFSMEDEDSEILRKQAYKNFFADFSPKMHNNTL